MPSLVYAPGIKVYIDSYKQGIIDVSEDITDFSMVRRSDGVSTFNFNLQNTRRKYDNVFTPNDRIVVMMKRLVWMRTFTGYLNSVPLFTAWPRVVPLTASCSLKRLQYFWWDSTVKASEELVRNALVAKTDFGIPDGGIKNVVLELLDKVVRWNDTAGVTGTSGAKVHIGNIPEDWYQFAVEIARSVREGVLESQALVAAMKAELGGGATIYGENAVTQSLIPPGEYGGRNWTESEVKHATTIILIGRRMGATDRDLVISLMVAMAESELRNTASKRVPGSETVPGIDGVTRGDEDSVGLFQQRDNGGWVEGGAGSDPIGAKRLNPEHAATAFFKVLLNMKNRGAKPMHVVGQQVQRSAFSSGSNYQAYERHATEMVQASTIPTSATQGGVRAAGGPNDITTTNYQGRGADATTGRALVEKAIALVQAAPNIPYTQAFTGTRMNLLTSPTPPGLDCSSFCQWVLYQQTGTLMLGNKELPRTAALQAQFYQSNGGKRISVEQGMNTPGALLFKNNYGNGPGPGTYHVVMSLGNGRQVVGAHRTGTVASVKSIGANYWDYAMLMPSIQYVASDTGQAPIPFYDANSTDPRANGDFPPRGGSGALPGTYGGTSSPDTQGTDAIDTLFGALPWQQTQSSGEGERYRGVISLANDEPILQYIKTLMNTTLRSFSSAPNGDFIGWFPDYYGLWGTAAVMQLEPIEVVDFTVDWSDDYFVTHQFVTGSKPGGGLDLQSGNYINSGGFVPIQTTAGIASIDEPAIMRALFGYDQTPEATEQFTYFIYQRFGARPNWTEQPGITGHKGEFFYALFLFMRQWAYQYNANVDLTFMPEVWPGMLIQMPFFNFQAYVTTVTHSGSFGPGGGFKTQVNIASPARLSDKDDRLQGLPIGGKYEEGRSKGDPTFADRAAATSGPLKISDNDGAGGRGGI